MNNLTRGGLQAACIVNQSNKSQKVYCMFNPFEYTLTKNNSYDRKPTKGKNAPKAVFSQGGSQVLKLTLHFDTQDSGKDVRDLTDPLWDMMMVDPKTENRKNAKGSPPEVAFQWGKLYFKAYITNLSQKFTLFKMNGTPIRCTVDITLEQFVDVNDYGQASDMETTAANPPQEVTATEGERLDNLSAKIQGEARHYREIAEANNVDNPLSLRPGLILRS